jgi:hypothetical protein
MAIDGIHGDRPRRDPVQARNARRLQELEGEWTRIRAKSAASCGAGDKLRLESDLPVGGSGAASVAVARRRLRPLERLAQARIGRLRARETGAAPARDRSALRLDPAAPARPGAEPQQPHRGPQPRKPSHAGELEQREEERPLLVRVREQPLAISPYGMLRSIVAKSGKVGPGMQWPARRSVPRNASPTSDAQSIQRRASAFVSGSAGRSASPRAPACGEAVARGRGRVAGLDASGGLRDAPVPRERRRAAPPALDRGGRPPRTAKGDPVKLVPILRPLALLGGLALLSAPGVALAKEPPKVLVVVGVRAQDREAYLEKVATLEAITKRLGLPTARVWRATLAGEGTDTLYIATEYPSQAAMAEAQQKVAEDPEARRFLRELEKSGVRTVVDRSLLVEMSLE